MPAFANATSSRPYAAAASSIVRSSAPWSVTSATARAHVEPLAAKPLDLLLDICQQSTSIMVTRAPWAASTSP